MSSQPTVISQISSLQFQKLTIVSQTVRTVVFIWDCEPKAIYLVNLKTDEMTLCAGTQVPQGELEELGREVVLKRSTFGAVSKISFEVASDEDRLRGFLQRMGVRVFV